MNGNGPDIDQDVQTQVNHLVQWEDERVYVVRQTLKEAIHGVKSMTCKRSRDLPDVMRFMDVLREKRTPSALTLHEVSTQLSLSYSCCGEDN